MNTVFPTFVSYIFALIALILMVPVVIFTLECLAGIWPARKRVVSEMRIRPSVAILVPAHNESAGIGDTLGSIRGQMRAGDRLVVVADNCDDDTADIAGSAGAEVVVRHDTSRRGKGYALDAGMQYLRQKPCTIVVIVDADCRMEAGSLDQLAAAAVSSGRPIQARYLIKAPSDSGLNLAVAEFAFLIKNRLRPLGLSRLGLPCQLTGSGMAFPWSVINGAELATDHRVEDMKLGLDLAATGHPPAFCDRAAVTSLFPYSTQGVETQRQRWEGGHLSMIRLALGSLFNGSKVARFSHFIMLLDIMVPPLTLLVAACFVIFAVNTALALLGLGIAPLLFAGINVTLVSIAVGLCWLAHGRNVLPLRSLLLVPVYVASKMKLYPKAVTSGQNSAWIRTDRTGRN